ncbi:hypothetical protein MAPG_10245 [Magnaporthiopsis poae ATCC 64411]|uniref:Uncharacterized protein n=1 Tax=Magnaporthiopsis poae (strain ATCC 64411 / 73-15) TaxID=644358 RepID=A0A0C4EC31_MAGP6|nr:hypothetical protein MAPG_10245 [Magnaporthiopsis poae ATCC 64411]
MSTQNARLAALGYDEATESERKALEILDSALPSARPISTPAEAAAALNDLCILDAKERGEAGSFLWWFWDMVHELARLLPHEDTDAHDRLAAVVAALHSLPANRTVRLGGQWGEAGEEDIAPWKGLPMFGNTLREKMDDSDSRASSKAEKKQRYINLQTYAARVAGYGIVPLEMYAIWALVDALEGTMKRVRGAPDEVDVSPASIEDLPTKMACAAAWMIHAGHVLHGRDEEVSGATAGPLWMIQDKKEAAKLGRRLKGTNGLCPERWAMWKGRFAAVRDAGEGVDDTAREQAGAAIARMEEVEKGS